MLLQGIFIHKLMILCCSACILMRLHKLLICYYSLLYFPHNIRYVQKSFCSLWHVQTLTDQVSPSFKRFSINPSIHINLNQEFVMWKVLYEIHCGKHFFFPTASIFHLSNRSLLPSPCSVQLRADLHQQAPLPSDF